MAVYRTVAFRMPVVAISSLETRATDLETRATADEAASATVSTSVGTLSLSKADLSALSTTNARVSAADQACIVLVGADGALQVNQVPGSANVFVYDGTFQLLS